MKTTTNFFFGACVIAMGLAVGCDGGDDGGNGANSPYTGSSVAIEDLASELTAALCRKLTLCMSAALTTDSCDNLFSSNFDASFEPTAKAVADGRVIYDGKAAAELIKALDAATCENYDSVATRFDAESALAGTVALGGTCTVDVECAGAANCLGNGTCPGTCVAVSALGEDCLSSSDCQPGLTCGSSDTCVERRAWGATCTEEDACPTFAVCLADGNGAMTCQSLMSVYSGTLGASCSAADRVLCEEGLVCEIATVGSTAGVCVAKVTAGAACRAASPSMCPSGQYCQIATDATEGTCTDSPAAGEACGFIGDSYVLCAGSLSCAENVCVVPQANGQPCANEDVCASNYCKSGTCATELDCEETAGS